MEMSLLSEQSESINELEQQLAASQAREKVLREQLESLVLWASRATVSGCTPMEILYATAALNQPTDDSALKAALAAERERCASVCLDIVDGQQYAEAIRALGDEK